MIKPQDFMVQMTTMQVTNAKNDRERLKAIADFGNLFNRELFEVYGGVLAKKTGFARVKPRVKRPLRMSAPELRLFKTEDGVTLKLTRYKGGDKGPVILSPGFGTNSLAFAIDTIETNCPEFLFANGYDVWLFDYRASPDLQSASTQFSLDDIATQDYPVAVDEVLKVSGAKDVQILGPLRRLDDVFDEHAGGKAERQGPFGDLLATRLVPNLAAHQRVPCGTPHRLLLDDARRRDDDNGRGRGQVGRPARRRPAQGLPDQGALQEPRRAADSSSSTEKSTSTTI